METTSEGLLTPITEALAKENFNISLIFPTRVKPPEYELYFFRVARRYPLHMTYDSELKSIEPGETLGPNFVGTAGLGEGKDVFEIWEERPFTIYHFGIGIRPGEIWLYRSIPADVMQSGWAIELPPRMGDKRDYVPGHLSPYDNPTVMTETIVYHKLSFHVGLRNDSGRVIRPSLRFLGAGYELIPIAAREIIDKMIRGQIPCRFLTIGGLRFFTYNLPDEWKPYAVSLTQAEVERLLR